MTDRLRFVLNRLGERLWVKPTFFCLLSVVIALIAKFADFWAFSEKFPDISSDSVEKLLTVISGSMLVIAVFAVGSMLAAYESASNSATPRTFAVVVADDRSQNALSTFVGAFIFSIVGLVAITNGYYDKGGRFALLVITLVVFALVILSFLKWVDAIARLGRLGNTVAKVEQAAEDTLRRRRNCPTMGGVRSSGAMDGTPVELAEIGYIQHIDVASLQSLAETHELRVAVAMLPGRLTLPGQPVAYLSADRGALSDEVITKVLDCFVVGKSRTFDEDPRFGLVVLSEIASRALSPAVNDPGTAINIIGALARLLAIWASPPEDEPETGPDYDRVAVPELSLASMFEDAFSAIARDGAGSVEVMICLQKALAGLAALGNPAVSQQASAQADLAFRYAELALQLPSELSRLQAARGEVGS